MEQLTNPFVQYEVISNTSKPTPLSFLGEEDIKKISKAIKEEIDKYKDHVFFSGQTMSVGIILKFN